MAISFGKDRFKPNQMIIIGLCLTAAYWLLESLLYVIIYGNTTFFDRLVGLNIDDLAMRMLVLAFFLIFGSHAQYTLTQKRKADEALQATEGKYKTIIESIEDGYYELDIQGKLVFFNTSMCRIFGYSSDDLIGKNLAGLMAKETGNIFSQAINRVRHNGKPFNALDSKITKKDGSKGYIEMSLSSIKDYDNNRQGYRGIIRDVTSKKREEALRQEKLAAEASAKSKGEFLANMSHEIRTPLNSIIGLVELTLESKLTREQKEDLNVVVSASYGLLSVINDILDFSKIEAGKLELEENESSLRDLIGESLRIVAPKAHDKGLELAYRVKPDVPDRLMIDAARLRQVILNLVGNAIKFTEDGEIVVAVSRKESQEDRVTVQFEVKDTGIGVPEEKQERIFGAFDQADGSTSRKYGGTGLGLAVSTQLVNLMGGYMWLESDPGKGSTFLFTTTFGVRDPEDSTDKRYGHLPDIDIRGLRILIVDDNASSRDILQEMLESWEMFPVAAATAAEARDTLKQRKKLGMPFELVLIDSDMPEENGNSLAQWVDDRPEMGCRVIMMLTSTETQGDNQETIDQSICIYKPVRPSDLLEAAMLALGILTIDPDQAIQNEAPKLTIGDEPLHVLVAEDLLFNQKFVLRLLKKWHYTHVLAENGRKALEAFQKEKFDIVLMDIQMPEMDGHEVTQRIREHEKDSGSHMPIIAMTAHAMKGDREWCLEAGMDDYISKPIASGKLLEKILKLTQSHPSEVSRVPEPDKLAPAQAPKIDHPAFALPLQEILETLDGDMDFLKDLAATFIEDYPILLDDIDQAVKNGNADQLMRAAHGLKGMLKNFQAEVMADKANTLEQMGRENEIEGSQPLVAELKKELAQFRMTMEKEIFNESNQDG